MIQFCSDIFQTLILIRWISIIRDISLCFFQCLGSGSVGFAGFWLPGSQIRKQNADLRIRIQGVKHQPKTLCSQTKNLNCKKREIIKISSSLNGSLSFSIKIREKARDK